MAFYTSRVDDNGNELDRRHSARSLLSSMNGSMSRLNLSSRSCDAKSSVRYVNSAAFIEKIVPLADVSSSEENHHKFLDKSSECQSDIVPPLDLQSEDNYPTPRDYTFSYRKHCEAAKIVLKPDKAYETWLSAKRKLISDEAARRKKAEEQKRKEIEERKRLAKEKYEKWLANKTRLQQQQTSTLSQPPSTNCSKQTIKTVNSVEVFEKSTRPQISEEEAQVRLEEWERAKRLKEERRRILKRQEEEHQRVLEEQRREMAAEAWEKWLADAAKKPKPVPLNRGIFTLRGTISDIFVNPNEWQTVIPIAEEGDH